MVKSVGVYSKNGARIILRFFCHILFLESATNKVAMRATRNRVAVRTASCWTSVVPLRFGAARYTGKGGVP